MDALRDFLLAFWLGLLCAVSPCPLATNLAATGYLAKECGRPRLVFLSGWLYLLGRLSAYVAVGLLLASGLAAIPAAAHALQKFMPLLMGPLLVLAAMFLLELLSLPWPRGNPQAQLPPPATKSPLLGAYLLGLLFALAFCPTSAALFFGQILPLTLSTGHPLLPPVAFGLGTSLPVLAAALLLAAGVQGAGRLLQKATCAEVWLKRATGLFFLLTGLWMTCRVTLKLF
ncbi:MAG: aromatic aminobenezylarsenical efflux permease ArsG family transporter [Oligosphaeraceae bacterium]